MFKKNLLNSLPIVILAICLLITGCGQSQRNTDDSNTKGSNSAPIINQILRDPSGLSFNSTPQIISFNADVFDSEQSALTLTYEWDFGDGTTSNQITPVHTYTYQGEFYYALTVRDNGGLSAMQTSQTPVRIVGGNQRPEITAYDCDSPTPNPLVTINFTCTATDPDVGDTLTYAWDFGDGNTSTLQNPAHKYTESGVYQVWLTVSDQHGASHKRELAVGVGTNSKLAPVIEDLSFSPGTGQAPLTVSLNCTARDWDGSIISYAWDFGDGQTGSGQNVAHLYNKGGTFKITLTVEDNDHLFSYQEKYLYIWTDLE